MKKIDLNFENTKYMISSTSDFKKDLKLKFRQGKDLNKLALVVNTLTMEKN